MAIRVALRHVTEYHYDRPVLLGPQVIRLRPAPHSRTPIPSYALQITPAKHFLNWQQDPHGNFLARLVIPDKTTSFRIAVDLSADLTVINPFDFFVDEYAKDFPFEYEPALKKDLLPFLEPAKTGPKFEQYLREIDRTPRRITDFLVSINQKLWKDIKYLIRMEPGVQAPEDTLRLGSGSCRDSAWLLVQLLRRSGLAARFVSGYLIQLTADIPSLDGPSGPPQDFTDLHAWCEVYIPGAGWVGLDPTSGLLTGEGHIPLAATPDPFTAAPISGGIDECETEFHVEMSVTRTMEDPRVTKPYNEQQWEAIDHLGQKVDEQLVSDKITLTMGGEPTFVSIDDMESPEWNTAAVGVHKQKLSQILLRRLQRRFAPGAMLHYGQGKWYPGESLPRWAYSCLWRTDGEPIWNNPELIGDISRPDRVDVDRAGEFLCELADRLHVEGRYMRPAYEDVWQTIEQEQKLPVDVDPRKFDLDADEDRRRLARIINRGVSHPVGYALPLTKAWWQAQPRWTSGPWPFRSERLFLLPGDSPIGLRLPLDSLPLLGREDSRILYTVDPFAERHPLPGYQEIRRRAEVRLQELAQSASITGQSREDQSNARRRAATEQLRKIQSEEQETPPLTPLGVVATAICIEPRDGRLHIFMPPLERLEDYLELVGVIETVAEHYDQPVIIEGYMPPHDHRLGVLKVTPDPGVIEVNVHPARNWTELKEITTGVYEEARYSRLGTEKFQLDGRHTGTGGGNHIVIGGPSPAESPFLKRPDLLRSFIKFWNNHPALSYLFSTPFIGPTSQSPRVDEGRRDALYELEIACAQVPEFQSVPYWIVDRIFRNLLVDITGNTHRAEICIDKLYSPDHAAGRLGLVELRGFEMPPHSQMSLTQQLLVRSLVAHFWRNPYRAKIARWGTALHDRFLLPYFLWHNLCDVLDEPRQSGFHFEPDWFATHFEFRCPRIGEVTYNGMRLELRTALEPWYVLGEEAGGGGTTRYVDSSVERLQVLVQEFDSSRYAVTCNGRVVPLHETGRPGEYVAGVRYRGWQPPSCLHPTIPVQTPLTFDIIDILRERSIGGCRYHMDHPGGLNPAVYPVNALEAECRRAARFVRYGYAGGSVPYRPEPVSPEMPLTLDLRRFPQ